LATRLNNKLRRLSTVSACETKADRGEHCEEAPVQLPILIMEPEFTLRDIDEVRRVTNY
jgi:hypothetical protein